MNDEMKLKLPDDIKTTEIKGAQTGVSITTPVFDCPTHGEVTENSISFHGGSDPNWRVAYCHLCLFEHLPKLFESAGISYRIQ